MNLKKLPKIELHLHLDGSVRPSTALELGNIKKTDLVANKCDNLQEYLSKFDKVNTILQTSANLERVAYELALDLKEENVIYAEIRFAPTKHLKNNLSIDNVIESVLKGIKKVDVKINLILCLMRGEDEKTNLKVVSSALKYLNKGVCGIDLAGAENLYKTSEYKNLFSYIKKQNIPFTIHAGEADGVDSIKSAIEFGAKRIGHGVRCIEDNLLIDKIIKEKIVLEICPTSNIQTKVVDDIKNHPIYDLYQKGVMVTINTDNKTVSNVSLTDEYEKLYSTFNFSEDDFINMNKNAVFSAFITEKEKQKLLSILENKNMY